MCVSKMVILLLLKLSFFSYAETITFNKHPGTIQLNENNDSGRSLWNISATCYLKKYVDLLGLKVTVPKDPKECEECEISSNPDSKLFYISEKTVYKSACTITRCGNCPSCMRCSTGNGCLNGPAIYNIVVRCYTTSYNDSGISFLTVNVTEETPALNIRLPDTVYANNTMGVGTILATASRSSGQPIVEYTLLSPDSETSCKGTNNMFEINQENGQVDIATDPAMDYDFEYSIGVCIHSRRQTSCSNLTIIYDAAYREKTNREDNSIPIIWVVIVLASVGLIIISTIPLSILARKKLMKGGNSKRKGDLSNYPKRSKIYEKIDAMELGNVYEEVQPVNIQESESYEIVLKEAENGVEDNAKREDGNAIEDHTKEEGENGVEDNENGGRANNEYMKSQDKSLIEINHGEEEVVILINNRQRGDDEICYESTGSTGSTDTYLIPIDADMAIHNDLEQKKNKS